jgi:hypothetical protein
MIRAICQAQGVTYKDVEDHGHTDEDLPGCKIELIQIVVKPANHDVVGKGEWDRAGDCVV